MAEKGEREEQKYLYWGCQCWFLLLISSFFLFLFFIIVCLCLYSLGFFPVSFVLFIPDGVWL